MSDDDRDGDGDCDDRPLTANGIVHALEVHFAGGEVPGNGTRQWATFRELGARSGFSPRKIDLFAVGTWQSTARSLAIEVKVSRGDFQRELSDPDKRAAWDDIATEVWFAVPTGLVRVDEVPEGCGLFTVSRKGGVRAMKKARQRKLPHVPFAFVQVLARRVEDPRPALPVGTWSLPSGRVVTAGELRSLADRLHQRTTESQLRMMRDDQSLGKRYLRDQRTERINLGAMLHTLERFFRCPVKSPEELRRLLAQHGGGEVSMQDIAKRLRGLANEIAPPTGVAVGFDE